MTQQNGYLWLTFAWYPDDWWLSQSPRDIVNEDESCQLERIVEYSIAIDLFPYVPPEAYNDTTDVGLVSDMQLSWALIVRSSGVTSFSDMQLCGL